MQGLAQCHHCPTCNQKQHREQQRPTNAPAVRELSEQEHCARDATGQHRRDLTRANVSHRNVLRQELGQHRQGAKIDQAFDEVWEVDAPVQRARGS